jgi:hypothetical protein
VTPSSTFSIKKQITLTVNSAGVAGLVLGWCFEGGVIAGTLCPCNTDANAGGYEIGMVFSGSASETNLLLPGTPAYYGITLDQWNSTTSPIPVFYSNVRVVSAGLTGIYTANDFNSDGTITIASCPRNTLKGKLVAEGSSPTLSIDQVNALNGAETCSINVQKGASAVLKPIDSLSLAYYSPSQQYIEGADMPEQLLGGEMYYVVSGATEGTTHLVTLIINCEGIPVSNQFNLIATSPSFSDPIALAQAQNVCSEMPATVPLPVTGGLEPVGNLADKDQAKAIQAAHMKAMNGIETSLAHNPKHEPDQTPMFEKLIGGVGTAVTKGTEIFNTLSPLLSAIF